MIAISTIADGSYAIINQKAESTLRQAEARVSREPTLDGGVVLSHFGFSHGDRTVQVRALITAETAAVLESIHQTQSLVYLSMPEGFFSGAIKSLQTDNGELQMTFYIKERLDE